VRSKALGSAPFHWSLWLTAGFVQTGISVLGAGVVNQANTGQGVITGVGFVGAGAIIKEGASATGNATAAGVWTVGIIAAAVR
jgi:putative Mg2+ transporter-C (MgtC) family protein